VGECGALYPGGVTPPTRWLPLDGLAEADDPGGFKDLCCVIHLLVASLVEGVYGLINGQPGDSRENNEDNTARCWVNQSMGPQVLPHSHKPQGCRIKMGDPSHWIMYQMDTGIVTKIRKTPADTACLVGDYRLGGEIMGHSPELTTRRIPSAKGTKVEF